MTGNPEGQKLCVERKAVELITNAMMAFPNNQRILKHGSGALGNIARTYYTWD